jgi:glutamate 5-kinase
VAARKQWIAGTLRPAGAIHIDAGALRALRDGRSLLPAGVTGTLGRFEAGDTVSVLSADHREVARGVIAYSDVDTARIMGRRSAEIAALLGFRSRDELIHRDDLVIMTTAMGHAPATADDIEDETVRMQVLGAS